MANNNTEGILKYPLSYNNLPNYGNYIFYYDVTTGKLKYTFKYNRLPKYCGYTFKYPTQDNIYIENTIIGITQLKRNTFNDEIVYIPIRNYIDGNVYNNDYYIDKTFKSINSKIVYSMDGFIINGNRNSIGIFDESIETPTLSSYIIDIENPINSGKSTSYSIDINIPSVLADKNKAIKTSLNKDIILQDIIKHRIEIDNYIINKEIRDTVFIEKDIPNYIQHRNTYEESFDKLSQGEKYLDINKLERLKRFGHEGNIDEQIISEQEGKSLIIDKTKDIKREYEQIEQDTILEIGKFKRSVNTGKDQIKKGNKINKSTLDYEDNNFSTKLPNSSDIIDVENFTNMNSFNSSISNQETMMVKTPRNTQIDTDISIDKATVLVDEEERMDSLKSNMIRNIDTEIEERLSLHKRFWFLDNIGKMDIKILPNEDTIYPPRIELFNDTSSIHDYIYKYEDSFKNLNEEYEIRLYKSSINGLSIVESHKVDTLHDYKLNRDRIELTIVAQDNIPTETEYPYKVSFIINIDGIDFDYMIIEQPKGKFNNQFVFVSSEKFLSENHPIPMGEDMGIIEIPISIPLMVDFVNILLLIWSKMYHAYSGCVGTRAIQSLMELVYEWLTLETSLNINSIEAYNRCYRWLRWESEKVYNKAKFDPHLNGNKWVEEVLFEMIDYLEMHHFNKMPQWEDIDRMDEQRNDIFNNVHLDIPIVVDKFKGIRKRVLKKNKRFRDY